MSACEDPSPSCPHGPRGPALCWPVCPEGPAVPWLQRAGLHSEAGWGSSRPSWVPRDLPSVVCWDVSSSVAIWGVVRDASGVQEGTSFTT